MTSEEEEEEAVDWSNLPYDIVGSIMNDLITPDISDQIRCSAVCTPWRTVYADCFPFRQSPPPPFLIVPTPPRPSSSKNNKKKKKRNNNTKTLGFYNIIHKRVYNQFQVTIPSNRYFRGSSYSWLVAVDQDNDCQVRLFNPFLSTTTTVWSRCNLFSFISVDNNNEIPLPSLKHLPAVKEEVDDGDYHVCTHNSPSSYAYLRKAVLSCNPVHSTPPGYCIVMAIFGQRSRLAFCSPGDKTWTLVDHKTASPELSIDFDDVIYYKDRFLALHHHGTVIVLDPAQNMTITLEISSPPQFQVLPYDKVYLAVIEGVLFQIHRVVEFGDEDRVIKRQPYSTDIFGVFTLVDTTKNMYCDIAKLTLRKEDEDYGEVEWMMTKNLWGNTLFLGDNTSMSIRASEHSGLCKPNSIYFTDDFMNMYHCTPWNGPHDLGVFNLENETIENHYPTNHNTPIWPIPIWIKPAVMHTRTN